MNMSNYQVYEGWRLRAGVSWPAPAWPAWPASPPAWPPSCARCGGVTSRAGTRTDPQQTSSETELISCHQLTAHSAPDIASRRPLCMTSCRWRPGPWAVPSPPWPCRPPSRSGSCNSRHRSSCSAAASPPWTPACWTCPGCSPGSWKLRRNLTSSEEPESIRKETSNSIFFENIILLYVPF